MNQSSLKQRLGLSDGKDSVSKTEGNVLDTLVLLPELFDDLFYVSDEGVLAEGIQKVVEALPADTLSSDTSIMLQVIRECQYQARWGEDAHMRNTIPVIVDYLQAKEEAAGRTTISTNTRSENELRASSIRNELSKIIEHPFEVQVPIYWEYNGSFCKGLLDIVEFGPDYVQIYDFKKTAYSLYKFYAQARQLRMDFQQSFYWYGAIEFFKDKIVNYPILLPYSTADEALGDPIQLTATDIEIGRNGAFFTKSVKIAHQPEITHYNRVFGFNQAWSGPGTLIDKLDLDFLHRQNSEGYYQTGIWF